MMGALDGCLSVSGSLPSSRSSSQSPQDLWGPPGRQQTKVEGSLGLTLEPCSEVVGELLKEGGGGQQAWCRP